MQGRNTLQVKLVTVLAVLEGRARQAMVAGAIADSAPTATGLLATTANGFNVLACLHIRSEHITWN
jgi:hypothetical protein